MDEGDARAVGARARRLGDQAHAGGPEAGQGVLEVAHAVGDVVQPGAALLEDDQPHKMIARSRDWIFQAEAPYELTGLVPNVVFPTGLIRRGDELWMYYGAADSCVCLATCKLDDLLATLE